jgi:hypothetical protein
MNNTNRIRPSLSTVDLETIIGKEKLEEKINEQAHYKRSPNGKKADIVCSYLPLDPLADKGVSTSHGWKRLQCEWNERNALYHVRHNGLMLTTLINNHRKKEHIEYVTGIMLDYDKYWNTDTQEYRFTFESMRDITRTLPFTNFLFTSKSYGLIDDNNIAMEKLRIWIPFHYKSYLRLNQHEALEQQIIDILPDWNLPEMIDTSAIKGSWYYHSTPALKYYFHKAEFIDLSQFSLPVPNELNKQEKRNGQAQGKATTSTSSSNPAQKMNMGKTHDSDTESKITHISNAFTRDVKVTLDCGNEILISSCKTDKHYRIFCPFCDPTTRSNPDRDNAFLEYQPREKKFYLHCTSENTTYWEKFSGKFMLSDLVTDQHPFLYWSHTRDKFVYVQPDPQKEGEYILSSTVQSNLKFNFKHYGIPYDYPTLNEDFNPNNNYQVDLDTNLFNMFKVSSYLQYEKNNKDSSENEFPTIYKLLRHLFKKDNEYEHWLNWFATIFCTRKKVLTTWLLRGEQGAGKNVLFEHIIMPLLGKSNCKRVEDEDLKSQFNQYMHNTFFLVFNEIGLNNKDRNELNNKIKPIITDDTITLNDKMEKKVIVRNRLNCMFFSNFVIPIFVESSDRRFSIVTTGGNLLHESWFDETTFFELVENELPAFAQYLKNYPYNRKLANITLRNGEKDALQQASTSMFEEFASALQTGNLDYFNDVDYTSIFEELDDHAYRMCFRDMLNDIVDKNRILNSLAIGIFNQLYIKEKEGIKIRKLTTTLKLYGIETADSNGSRYYVWKRKSNSNTNIHV